MPSISELIEVVKEQHKALDWCLAQFIERDPTFYPTKSPIWETIESGSRILTKLEIEEARGALRHSETTSSLAPEFVRGQEKVRMVSLCFTGVTLYGVDYLGRIWFIDMKDGSWALHGNPTEEEAVER